MSAPAVPPAFGAARLRLVGRRLGALAVDAALCAALLAGVVHGANALCGRFGVTPFVAFWAADPPVVALATERGRPVVEREVDGTRRETVGVRETRVLADGSVFVYAVMEIALTPPGGATEIRREELLIGRPRAWVARLWATGALFALVPLLLAAACEGGRRQATPGKRLFGLIVTGRDGARVSPGRALARQGFKLAEVVCTFGGGYLLAMLADRPDAFHDILAGTHVVPA